MHSPYLRHLRERSTDGGHHASVVTQNHCRVLCSPWSYNGVLGPSIVTLTKESRILVYSQLRIGVLMCFTAEKTHSTSADEAGSTAIQAERDTMRG